MEADFWHDCWQRNALGFHQHSVHPFLDDHLSSLLSQPAQQVLVPLCGKSLDMIWLAQRLKVIGAELSAIACADFFKEQKLAYHKQSHGQFNRYWFDNISLYQGDFWQLSAKDLGIIDWIYDRAALIALPASLQHQYVEHLMTFMSASTTLCLITLEFPTKELDGPPFPVFADDLKKLFSACQINCIASRELADKRFAQRTLKVSQLIERLYFITKA